MPAKSEYRRKFIVDKTELKENYALLLSFRKARKSLEYHHTPLTWICGDDENANQDDGTDRKRSRKRKSIPNSAQESCSKEPRLTVEHDAKRQRKVDSSLDKSLVKSPSKATQTGEALPEVAVETADRVKSKSPSRKSRKSIPMSSRAPLLAYGWADEESITQKRTFNTLAPQDQVRESSLNAQRHRDLRRKRRQTVKERLAKEKERQQALIDSLADVDVWQTEYQKSFCKK